MQQLRFKYDLWKLNSGIKITLLVLLLAIHLIAIPPRTAAGSVLTLSVPEEYATIQEAIDAASDGDTVLIEEGTYSGSGNINLDFRGKAIRLKSVSGPEKCIIDCKSDGRGIYFRSTDSSQSVVSGFTFKNGKAENGGGILIEDCSPTIENCAFQGNVADENGGGVSVYNASPQINDCTFMENSAGEWGGGLYNYRAMSVIANSTFTVNSCSSPNGGGGGMANGYESQVLITDCVFESNTAFDDGGGLFNSDANPAISRCTFKDNTCGGSGGGLRNTRSSPQIGDCTFTNNTAKWGGGMSDNWSSPVIDNCSFIDNQASSEGGGLHEHDAASTISYCNFLRNTAPYGGGIGNFTETVAEPTQLINCTFIENSATNGGGGMRNWTTDAIIIECYFENNLARWGGAIELSGSDLSITSCEFNDNEVYENGGGVYIDESTVYITDSIYLNNSADRGGAIFGVESEAILVNCILADNIAAKFGAAISSHDSQFEIGNCTLCNNAAKKDGGGIYGDGSTAVITNSILWDNLPNYITPGVLFEIAYSNLSELLPQYESPDNISFDPRLTTSFELMPDSPCIDSGNNSYLHLQELDFQGGTRIFDGDEDGVAIVDMGAIEYIPGSTVAEEDISDDKFIELDSIVWLIIGAIVLLILFSFLVIMVTYKNRRNNLRR